MARTKKRADQYIIPVIETIPSSEELGSLGVAHLKRLWFRRMATLADSSDNEPNPEWAVDKLLMHGIGVGLEQMARFLARPRSFEELENWILDLNGGVLDPARIRRLNAALLSLPYDPDTEKWILAIENSPDVPTSDELEFWNQNGYVILRNAISQDECAAVADLVYNTVGASPNSPETWYERRNTQGIMAQVFQHPALQPARRSARIHKAFAQLWGCSDLFSTTDRCGFNPEHHYKKTFNLRKSMSPS
ncbi:MAG TPA: hypothetical protein VEZ90_00305 [Blastocatellia bacterium]|nr:hypothetical protein [Blastocatellia bacterium]